MDKRRISNKKQLVEKVRERYSRIATGEASACCGPETTQGEAAIAAGIGYAPEDLEGAAGEANLGLGCGAPVSLLELEAGETVLDLGSGGGIDCFLAARRVGPSGHVIGVDMTAEMIARARASAAKEGLQHVDFRQGRLEKLPVADASVDAVTSNCVINLVPDKKAVFREIARVLRPGGRLVISDIVLDGELPPAVSDDVLAYVGCVSGALQRDSYMALLAEAGLAEVTVLRDVDYLAAIGDAAPAELQELAARTGIKRADLEGKVRSLTYRARRPRR